MIDDSNDDVTSKILRAHAEQAEQRDRPIAESMEALRKGGGFALRTPQKYWGAWANAETVARRLSRLGRACPSTAWLAGTCATGKSIVAAVFPDELQSELFADPDALFCGSGVPKARGERGPEGVRVSGRWANVSGCEDAVWAELALMVDDTYCFAVVPVADLTIERTWCMAGMRGTGSHTLVADDLLVPTERVAPAGGAFTTVDILFYAITVLGPVVGAARGALDAVESMFASDRKPFATSYSRMGESPGARHWLAEATHLVNRAEATMLASARAVDAADLSETDGARLHMELADAGRDCRAAVERMLDLHGPSGFNTANVLQRYWRDIAVGSRHPHLNPYLAAETYGTTLVAGI